MSSECNNIKLVIRNDKSKVVCAMCKKCLITVNHDVCVLNYVNGMKLRGKKQKVKVSNIANQTKHKPQVWKPKNVGPKERLASPKPSKPRMCLRWSPTGKIFDFKGKLIASSESNGDKACTPNPQEPTIKWFPNSTFFLDSYSISRGVMSFFDQKIKHLRRLNLSKRIMFILQAPVIIEEPTTTQNFKIQSWERRNRSLVEVAEPCLSFLVMYFLWVEAIATACYTQNRFIIHRLFDKKPYELINGRKPDISFLHVFGALCYPKNDREDIRKLGAKAMDFEQSSLKLDLQSMTSGQNLSDGDICMYALTVSTMQPKNVNEAMGPDLHGLNQAKEELLSVQGFIDANHPSHGYKLKKALYGLKQALRAWYDELLTFLGIIDPTLFIRCFDDDILVVQVTDI
ncbi:retrovirus-related pol polyprotein from transposon TNT 1-94 [Tanacetum coccineum]|uniref:Retrovirus-related pol polyprotein from transposon TNT 1-94 n=1 Tax=Tanacetum coccineum TaxID=301880 RepID=A0ABQ5JBV6_9ASTR